MKESEKIFVPAEMMRDVIVKPKNIRLRHALTVCELSSNRFAFLRTQLRSLKRSLKRLKRSETSEPVIIYENNYVPNSINVLNKIKEILPRNKFTAKNNKIQLSKDCDKDVLISLLENTLMFSQ